jgi:hypothetical protein
MSSAPIFKYNDGSTLYRTSAKWLTMIPVWEANRVMDEAHVADLERTISDPTNIQGIFSIVEYLEKDALTKEPVTKLIDGQHRCEVIRRYFQNTPNADDFSVLVRIYKVAQWEDTVRLFQEINHAKPMIYKGSPTERLHDIVAALKKRFIGERPDGKLVALIRPGSVRPYLNVEHLEEALQRNEITATPSQVVAHAVAMNEFFAADITRINARFTQVMLDRARGYNFFLGLDPKCSWLLGLSEIKSLSK